MPVHLPDTVDAAVAQLAEDPTATRVGRGHRPHGRGERRPSPTRPHRGGGQPDRGAAFVAPQRRRGRRSRSAPRSATGRWRPDRSPSCSPRSPRRRGPSAPHRSAMPARSAATSGPARRRATGFRCWRHWMRVVEFAGPGGRRTMPVTDFMVGVKRTALEPGEMIVSVTAAARRRVGRDTPRSGSATRW